MIQQKQRELQVIRTNETKGLEELQDYWSKNRIVPKGLVDTLDVVYLCGKK